MCTGKREKEEALGYRRRVFGQQTEGQGEKSRKQEKAEMAAEQVQGSRAARRGSRVVPTLPAQPSGFPQPIPDRRTSQHLAGKGSVDLSQRFHKLFRLKQLKGFF